MMLKSCLVAVLAALSLAGAEGTVEKAAPRNGPAFNGKAPAHSNAPASNRVPVNNNAPGRRAQQAKPSAANLVRNSPLADKRPGAVQGAGCRRRCDSSSSSSHYQPSPILTPCGSDCNRIAVIPDAGFYSFPYAGSNTFSPRSFYICTDKTLFLSVTNCFLQGDYFEVFDNGQPILITDEGNNFPGFPQGVNSPVNDPSTCLASLDFNHGSAVLNPGTHLLTILVGASWYTGGAGFLRVDSACLINGQMQPCCMADGNNGESCPQFIVA